VAFALVASRAGLTVGAEALCGVIITLVVVALRLEAGDVERRAEMLRQFSETDALTGLRNRRGLIETIGSALRTGERRREPVSLAFFDLDGFKAVNDRLGHAAGDRLLATVASVLRGNLRAGMDEAFRVGGDELVVVMRGTSVEGARAFADRVRHGLKAHPAITRLAVAVDVSAGVAGARRGETAEECLARADALMFRAKGQGRGRTQCDAGEPPLRAVPMPMAKPAA
jgi:diguanylate cyclase (GGDEF)-like protein